MFIFLGISISKKSKPRIRTSNKVLDISYPNTSVIKEVPIKEVHNLGIGYFGAIGKRGKNS